MRPVLVRALCVKVLRVCLRVTRARWLIAAVFVPLFFTFLVITANIAIKSLPHNPKTTDIDASDFARTFLRSQALDKLGPLVVFAVGLDSALAVQLQRSFAVALGLEDAWPPVNHALVPVSSPEEMEQMCTEHTCLAGVGFSGNSSSTVPAIVLRVYSPKKLAQVYSNNNDLRLNHYLLLPKLQLAADKALLQTFFNQTSAESLSAAALELPSQALRRTLLKFVRDYGGAVFFVAAFVALLYVFIMDLLLETDRSLRDGLYLMGVSKLEYAMSWLIPIFVASVPVWFILAAIVGSLLPSASYGVLLVLYILTGACCLLICLILDTFLSSPETGPLCGILIFAACVGGGVAVVAGPASLSTSLASRYAMCLLPPAGWVLAFADLAEKELSASIVAFSAPDQPRGVHAGIVCGFLCLDVVLYALLAWYLSEVVPQRLGTARHPLFFLGGRWRNAAAPTRRRGEQGLQEALVLEEARPLPSQSTVGISIQGLSKTFVDGSGNVVRALSNVSMDIAQGSVLALLGQNGAGKSTLISLLTGVTSPSGGDAFISGHSIRSASARRLNLVGVCPQTDVLFDGLTVRETLQMFAVIKQVPVAETQAAVNATLVTLDMVGKADDQATKLSGGQKRRLCCGVAFLGGSPVVILDEVSSGVDPVARRGLLDLIMKNKEGRTIIFTSHFLDEANEIADRIVIMGNGRVRASGSAMELKRQFNIGYQLTIVLHQTATEQLVQELNEIIEELAPGTPPGTSAGSQVDFCLDEQARVGPLLQRLEGHQAVQSFEVSLHTLHETFRKVAERELPKPSEAQVRNALSGGTALPASPPPRPTALRQTAAMLRKSLTVLSRLGMLLAFRIAVPLAAALIAALLLRSQSFGECHHPPAERPLRLLSSFSGEATLFLTPGEQQVEVREALQAIESNFTVAVIDSTSEFVSEMLKKRNSLPPALELVGTAATSVISTLENTVPVIALQSLAFNAIIRASPSHTDKISETSLQLFPASASSVALENLNLHAVGAFVCLIVGFTLMSLLGALPLVRERLSGSRAHQFSSGASVCGYWLVQLAVDTALALPICAVATGLVALAHGGALGTNAGWTFLTLFAYSLSISTSVYLASQLIAQAAVLILVILSIVIVHPFVVFFVTYLAIVGTQGVLFAGAPVIGIVFSLQMPATAFLWALMQLTNLEQVRCLADLSQRPVAEAVWPPIFVLFLQAALLFGAALAVDLLPYWISSRRSDSRPSTAPDGLSVDSLTKVHPGMTTAAVNNLSLSVPKGSCLALLGSNGCGKTSTFNTICGHSLPTSGDCHVGGHSVVSELQQARAGLGVCPQVDPLPGMMTAREIVALYARLRGISEPDVPSTVDRLIQRLSLAPHANKMPSQLSGGNRRKLSVAVAVVGMPPVVLLDEPTTGQDPISKRCVWHVATELRQHSAVLLTTHSLEEAEAVNTQVAIMGHGRLLCTGTLPVLRQQQASGNLIDLVLTDTTRDPRSLALPDITDVLPPSAHDPNRIKLRTSAPLSEAFAACEVLQREGTITDFHVSRTTLEQIFLDVVTADDSTSAAAKTIPKLLRRWDRGLVGVTSQLVANGLWLTLGLGAVPVILGFIFSLLSGLMFPLWPAAFLGLGRVALTATAFSAHSELVRQWSVEGHIKRDASWPIRTYWRCVEGWTWMTAGWSLAGGHLLCGVALAASVVGLPVAIVHLRLARLAIAFYWVPPKPSAGCCNPSQPPAAPERVEPPVSGV